MRANLEWFRTFKAIFESGTMSGAAKLLNASQPGVGMHLNALETYTGYPLFERTPRRMVPTERGQLLYQQVIQSLVTLEEIEDRFRRKSGQDRITVSVGMCVETFQQALERHIPDLDFNLIMQFGDNDKLIDMLENGVVDLILSSTPRPSNNITYEPFTTERLILVAGKTTDTSAWADIDLQDKAAVKAWLKKQLWYNTASDVKLLRRFWEVNFNEEPDFVPNYVVPNKFSIIRCLSAGHGVAVLPDFLSREAIAGGAIMNLWEGYTPVENPIYFGKRKNAYAMEKITCISNMLREEFQEQPDVAAV